MKKNNRQENRKNRRFAVIAAGVLAVSGIGAGLFNMMAESTVQAAVTEAEAIPTSYHVPAEDSGPEVPAVRKAEETATTLQYRVVESSLNKETPTETDLTMEEAAAIGMKYLADIMGFDKAGANVYMCYNSGTETFPRAFWDGDVRFGEEVLIDDDTWHFFIDAVTGELFNLSCTETLDADVSLGYDVSLEKNYGVYAEAAKEIAERCDLVSGLVAEVKYGSQGYSSNNPDITMEVYGENGQMAILSFSRYNQRFLGLITDTSRVISDRAMEDLMKQDAEATDWQTETLEDGSVISFR